MRALALACLLAPFLFGASCGREWAPTGVEVEMLPLDTAKKICDQHAEKRATRRRPPGSVGLPGEDDTDWGAYQAAFMRCMRHYGWELRRPAEADPPEEPESETS